MKLENLKKKSVWVALISFIVLICKSYKLFELPDNLDIMVNSLLGILVMLGIVVDDSKE
jgi:uncharacterized membrane protein